MDNDNDIFAREGGVYEIGEGICIFGAPVRCEFPSTDLAGKDFMGALAKHAKDGETVKVHFVEGARGRTLAITGNGPESEARARFYAFCGLHADSSATALRSLVTAARAIVVDGAASPEQVERLRDALDFVGARS